MLNFDTLFFREHISPDEKIEKVFHRHIFVMIEDLIIWMFFGAVLPSFLFFYDAYGVRTVLDSTYIHAYLFILYFILLYKIFDWYLDVWIATDKALVDMRWKWFTPQLLYISYDKIESIEVRTPSWFYLTIGISDVIIHMPAKEFHMLSSAQAPREIVEFLREKNVSKDEKEENEDPDNREPFDVLVDALSGVVKNHLDTGGKKYIDNDYVEKLDGTLSVGAPIDLRSDEEKNLVENWKSRHKKIPVASSEEK